MKPGKTDWYKEGWNLDIKMQSWVEDTSNQVDFKIQTMKLTGDERILDLACGYGRHCLEFARRGFRVVGVDITEAFIEDARKEACKSNLAAEFILSDIRQVDFNQEFDIVLNMADGAIGYLENDKENLKIFNLIEKALKPGGKHFMDIMSADYADNHFPCKFWDAGEHGLTLSQFEWDRERKILLYGQNDIMYQSILKKPSFNQGNPTRLYHAGEIDEIMHQRGMQVVEKYGKFNGTPASSDEMQMLVFSQKKIL